MDTSLIVSVIIACVASSGLWSFLQYMFARKDKSAEFVTKDDLKALPNTCVIKAEVDGVKEDMTTLNDNVELLKQGMQALLRDQLVHNYNKWTERGYAPIYARENFTNIYEKYHALGANGVMTNLHNKFLELPTEPPIHSTTLVEQQEE